MNGLHNLVAAGKVLYLVSRSHMSLPDCLTLSDSQGISDTPAWVVAQANTYARCMGKTPFVIYQGSWNVLQRDFERDIIPMARSLGTFGARHSGKLSRRIVNLVSRPCACPMECARRR